MLSRQSLGLILLRRTRLGRGLIRPLA